MLRISGLCREFLRWQRLHVTFVVQSALCSFGTQRYLPRSNAAGAWNQFSRSSAARITDALHPISSPPYSYTVHCFSTGTFFCLSIAFCRWISLSEVFSQARPYSIALNVSHFSNERIVDTFEKSVCVCVCHLHATYGATAADMHRARTEGQLMSTVNICGLGLTVIIHFHSCDVWSAN